MRSHPVPIRMKLKESDITPEVLFRQRRRILQMAALAPCLAWHGSAAAKAADFANGEEPNSYEDITRYNNFYEFGTDKSDPAKHAHRLTTAPWTVTVDGQCDAGGQFDLDQLLKRVTLEERIYRLRCVEAWSMVVPWQGFELGSLLKTFQPRSSAKYVAFETAVRPAEMPGLKYSSIDWPYREGLRMDEAMHSLTLLATGLYGKPMPKQNGAPLRLVVPWKYGFKSIKSIVRIHFSETRPATTWNMLQPREYGFYANVNPQVDHPRWSQARERRIGEWFKRDTLMFNGYAEQVAGLYRGMDLRKEY